MHLLERITKVGFCPRIKAEVGNNRPRQLELASTNPIKIGDQHDATHNDREVCQTTACDLFRRKRCIGHSEVYLELRKHDAARKPTGS